MAPLHHRKWQIIAAIVTTQVCMRQITAQEIGPVQNPNEYDLVLVVRQATYDVSTDAFYAQEIESAATTLEGTLQVETDLGQYFEFESRAARRDFIDQMGGLSFMSDGITRFRDVVVDAELAIFGAAGHTPPNDPHYTQGDQCNIDFHRIHNSWDTFPTLTYTPVTIAIVDAGADFDHPDLAGRLLDIDNSNFSCDLGTHSYENSITKHGTRTAGIVGAISNNPSGPLGVAGCTPTVSGVPIIRVLPIKTRTVDGQDLCTTADHIRKAIEFAVTNDADVIVLPFEMTPNTPVTTAISDAVDRDIVVLASAGNDDDHPGAQQMYNTFGKGAKFPASHTDVIAVGSVTCANMKSPSSNWGTDIEVSAVGHAIWTTSHGGGYNVDIGTSWAVPQVGAIAGLIKSIIPFAREEDIKSLIYQSTFPTIGGSGSPPPQANKYGTIDFEMAIQDTLATQPPPLCPNLPSDTALKLKGKEPFRSEFYIWDASTLQEDPIEIKVDQCLALSSIAPVSPTDAQHFRAKSILTGNEEKTEFELRFHVTGLPSTLRLQMTGQLDSTDNAPREIEVRFRNYDKKKWGAATNKTLDSGVFDEKKWPINITLGTDVVDHIASPGGVVRCRIRVRHAQSGSKKMPFSISIDEATLLTD